MGTYNVGGKSLDIQPQDYVNAANFIAANLDKPEVIAQAAERMGISLEDLTKATNVGLDMYAPKAPDVNQAQVANWFADQKNVNYGDAADYVKDLVQAAAAAAPAPAPAPAPAARTFSNKQYLDVGNYLLNNINKPDFYKTVNSLMAQEGISKADLLKAAQTVRPGITSGDIDRFLSGNYTPPASVNFDTGIRNQPTTSRSGTGVAVQGDSGLRSGYAPYVQRMLERASAEADVPFQKYTGESPLLESARAGIANLTTPAQFLQGSNLAQAAGIGALDYGKYKPTSFTTGTFANPNYTPQPSPQDVVNKGRGEEGGLKTLVQGYDDGGAVNVNSITPYISNDPASRSIQNFDPFNANMGQVFDPNSRDMRNAVNVGGKSSVVADGNSKVINASDPVNYGGQNVTNVQASYMSPYMQNVVDTQQREAKRQSDIAGQYIGAKAAGAGAFGGSRYGLVEAENQRNLARQLGDIQARGLQEAYTSGLGQFNTEQQRSLEAQKMAEQSRQFGADLGLKGLQTGIQAGQVLGNLGQQQGYLDLATLKQMADLGKDERTFDYNEFLRGEKYPYENLTFMRNILQGLPISSADSYSPGGSSDAFNTFLQSLASMNKIIPGSAEGGLISGIASLANDD